MSHPDWIHKGMNVAVFTSHFKGALEGIQGALPAHSEAHAAFGCWINALVSNPQTLLLSVRSLLDYLLVGGNAAALLGGHRGNLSQDSFGPVGQSLPALLGQAENADSTFRVWLGVFGLVRIALVFNQSDLMGGDCKRAIGVTTQDVDGAEARLKEHYNRKHKKERINQLLGEVLAFIENDPQGNKALTTTKEWAKVMSTIGQVGTKISASTSGITGLINDVVGKTEGGGSATGEEDPIVILDCIGNILSSVAHFSQDKDNMVRLQDKTLLDEFNSLKGELMTSALPLLGQLVPMLPMAMNLT